VFDSVEDVAGGRPSRAPKAAEGPAPVRQLRPGRDAIVAAARQLFSARGYEGTPLRAVSDALGLTKAAVYYHFQAKDDLLVAIVEPVVGRLEDLVHVHEQAGMPSLDANRAFLSDYVEVLIGAPEVTGLLLRDPSVADHPLGRRFAALHLRMRARLGAGPTLASGIRAAAALRAVELAVVDFPEADHRQLGATAVGVALAVLDPGDADWASQTP
jgi:AcrR family transcriptional regulator